MSKPLPTPQNSPELIPFAAEIERMLEGAQIYQRSRPLYIRQVVPKDVGEILVTWIKDPDTGDLKIEGDGVKLEMGMFILRNPNPIQSTEDAAGVQSIFNEYVCNDRAYMSKHYGQEVLDTLTGEFQLKRKKGQLKAVQITKEIFAKFSAMGCVDEVNRIHIAVDFSPFVMYAYEGGWLNSNGYSIGSVEMTENYEPVPAAKITPMGAALAQHGVLSVSVSTKSDSDKDASGTFKLA